MTLSGLLLVSALGAFYTSRPVDPAEDLKLLRTEVVQHRAEVEPWRDRIRIYLELGELQTIPELIGLLAETFPQEPSFQEARMIFLSFQGKHEEAIAVGEALLRDHPDYPTIRANLGRVYLAARKKAEGVNLLLSALGRGPLRVEDWDLLLEGLGVKGPHPDAVVETLRQKIARHPQTASLRYVLMVVLTRLGRYGEARAILSEFPELAAHPDLQRFLADTVGG